MVAKLRKNLNICKKKAKKKQELHLCAASAIVYGMIFILIHVANKTHRHSIVAVIVTIV